VTGQEREEVWKLNGREIHVDGGPGANNAILEAKWTGGDKQWASSPYNPANGLFDETKTVDQAAMLLALNRSLAGPGVHYLVSNQEGAAFFTALFREWFPEQMASGELTVEYKSGAGM
jgi:hypothetical protein